MDKSPLSQSMSGIFGRPASSLLVAETKSLPTIESNVGKIAEMAKRIAELEKQLAEREQTINSLERSLSERDEASLMVSWDSIPDDMVICLFNLSIYFADSININDFYVNFIQNIETMRRKLAEQTHLMVARENAYQDLREELNVAVNNRDRGMQTIQLLMAKTKDMTDEIERYKMKEVRVASKKPIQSKCIDS